MTATKTRCNKMGSRKKKRLAFYICMLALPLLQFLIFYVYVNFNSITMAFTKYELTDSGYVRQFAWFDNFSVALQHIGERFYMVRNSLLLFVIDLFIGLTLAMVFSYYVYKSYAGHRLFRTILFLPQVVSGVVFALIFKHIAEEVYPYVMLNVYGKDVTGLVSTVSTQFVTILVYSVWMSFGVNVLLFTGSMSGINPSLIESAQLDGCNSFREFIHVVVPMVFPTLISFIVLTVAGIFTNQMNLYTFLQKDAGRSATLGYDLYLQSLGATNKPNSLVTADEYLNYPQLSAYGLIVTLILFPITMFIRKLLTKYGPSAE